MNKKAMQQLILEALTKRLGDSFDITIRETLKTNCKRDALIIQKKGDNISPNIYLEDYYRELEDGAEPEQVADTILKAFSYPPKLSAQDNINSYLDFDHVKNKLFIQLINVQLNKELLEDVPYSLFLHDFAIVIRCLVENADNEIQSFLVHNTFMKLWNTDLETLMHLAIKNTRELFRVDIIGMNDILMKTDPSLKLVPNSGIFWILTNRIHIMGASAVLFDDILKDFSDEHGSFYAVFSSVHEVLLIPSENNNDLDTITQMNQQVNATGVLQEEILGTRAYYYKQGSGFIL